MHQTRQLKNVFGLVGLLMALAIPAPGLSQTAVPGPTDPFAGQGEPVTFTLEGALSSRSATLAPASPHATGWQTFNSEPFTTTLWPAAWSSVSRATALPNARWGTGTITGTNFAAWVMGAQTVVTFGTGEVYTDGIDSWMIYGPISAARLWDVSLDFDYFSRSQSGDYFTVGYSTNGITFTGFRLSGLMSDWNHGQMDWRLGLSAPQVWVAFGFTSNSDGLVEQGAWVDNLVIRGYYGTTSFLPVALRNWTVVLPGFTDDFSNVASGWPRAIYYRGTAPDGPVLDVNYDSGNYRMKIMLDYNARNNRRMGTIPAPYTNTYTNYNISVDQYFTRASDQVIDPQDGKAGLVFAANSTYTTTYVVEWNYQGNCAVTKYLNVTRPTAVYADPLVTIPLLGWQGCTGLGLQAGYNKLNHIIVEVRGTKATIYIANTTPRVKLFEFTDSALQTQRQVGLVVGSYDWTPVETRFDNFSLVSVQ